jgi:hypothetical protein
VPRRYAVDSSQQSASMPSSPVHRSIPPTQGTVPTLFCFPNNPGLKLNAAHPFSYVPCAYLATLVRFFPDFLDRYISPSATSRSRSRMDVLASREATPKETVT